MNTLIGKLRELEQNTKHAGRDPDFRPQTTYSQQLIHTAKNPLWILMMVGVFCLIGGFVAIQNQVETNREILDHRTALFHTLGDKIDRSVEASMKAINHTQELRDEIVRLKSIIVDQKRQIDQVKRATPK